MKRPVSILLKLCMAVMIAAMSILPGKAAVEKFNNFLDTTQVLVPSATLTVFDTSWSKHYFNYKNWKITDLLKLSFSPESKKYYSTSFRVWVKFSIAEYDNWHGITRVDTVTLSITYNPGKGTNYNDLSVFRFHGAQKFVATIMNVSSTIGSYPGAAPTNLYVEGDINSERYYKFNCDTANVDTFSRYYNDTTKELQLSWPRIRGAESYDLEWTYVGDADLDSTGRLKIIPANQLPWTFAGHSSRITTSDPSYRISMVFPRGYLLYRMRPIGIDTLHPDHKHIGRWTVGDTTQVVSAFPGYYQIDTVKAHEPYLNWTYSAEYAEEAKKKEIVNYFDGSNRKRQTVTRSNSNYDAIVQESIYDYYGRQAIQVLPSPTFLPAIDYYPNFNRNMSNTAYGPANFLPVSCDTPAAQAMDTTSGASYYYSGMNPNKNYLEGAFVPRANGYPFVQTAYMPDNTGRIAAVSAPGLDHNLGSQHETKYMYGTPDPEELNRLFGDEVGYAVHYKKTVSVDANGQVTVTYKDMSGKVIATALAGDLPINLKPADTGSVVTTDNLAPKNTYDSLTGKLQILESFVAVGHATTYTIKYGINTAAYKTCTAKAVCDDCVYDLSIHLTDNCGVSYYHLDTTIGRTNPGDNTHCAGSPDSSYKTIVLTLPPGSYFLDKTLSVNQAALDSYTALFVIDTASCVSTVRSYISKAGTMQAGNSCTGSSGTYSGYATPCQGAYMMMLADVSPGGQYADTTFGIHDCHLSVYDNHPDLPGRDTANWKHPYSPYRDEFGNLDSVRLGGINYSPKSLSRGLFMRYFKHSWAQSLVHYHPEYCYYNWCLFNGVSYQRDDSLQVINTYANAKAHGLLPNPITNDSLFTSSRYPGTMAVYADTMKAQMQREMNLYKSVTDTHTHITYHYSIYMAAAMTTCRDSLSFDSLYYGCINKRYTNNSMLWAHMDSNLCTQDQYWLALRSMYLGLKQKYEEKIRQNYAIANKCYDACIGIPAYDSVFDPYAFTCTNVALPFYYGLTFPLYARCAISRYNGHTDTLQPCHRDACYKHKAPRFGGWSQQMGFDVFRSYSTKASRDSLVTKNKDSLSYTCNRYCLGNVKNWWMKIKGCGQSYPASFRTDSAAIINALLNICEKGCDPTHPFGASTLNPDSPSITFMGDTGIRNFDTVLTIAFGAHYKTLLCDGGLINSPPPYDSISNGMNAYVSNLDACGCDKILHVDSLYTHSLTKPYGVAEPADWFKLLYNTSLLNFGTLVCSCKDAWALGKGNNYSNWTATKPWQEVSLNNLLHDSFLVPSAISCSPSMGTSGGCIDCQELETSINAFNTANPHSFGSPYYNRLLENYLNRFYGLSLSYQDYLGFMKNCSAASAFATTCTTPTTQAGDLRFFIKEILSGISLHTYKDAFVMNNTNAFYFRKSLYYATDTIIRCGLRYTPIYISKNVLKAQISDTCGFNCLLTLTLPDTSKRFSSASVCSGCTISADTPSYPGAHYNFVLPVTYGGATINMKGSTTCYPIEYCTPVPQTAELCYPLIARTKTPDAYDLETTHTDTCSCLKLIKVYNYVINTMHIPRDSLARHHADMDTAFYRIYGFYPDSSYKAFYLSGCVDAYQHTLTHDTFNYSAMTWGTSYLNNIKNGTVLNFLTCKNCQSCTDYEAAVNTFNQTADGSIKTGAYYLRLQDYLKSVKGYPVTVSAASGCVPCGSYSAYVCDSINQTALDFRAFLNTLVIHNALTSATPVTISSPLYSIFTGTELNQFPAAATIQDSTYDNGAGVTNVIKYRNGIGTLLGSCTFTLGGFPFFTLAALDSVTGIALTPKNIGSNTNFTVTGWQHSGMTAIPLPLHGTVSCYSLGNCCLIDNRKLCNKPPLVVNQDSDICNSDMAKIANEQGRWYYQKYQDSLKQGFRRRYINKCMGGVRESMTMKYRFNAFHYTLFYYNQAGNLIKTVPPGGVRPITRQSQLDSVEMLRHYPSLAQIYPSHTLITNKQYNTLNNIIIANTPDAGITETWYDRVGRPALVQNAKQAPLHQFGYTKYDGISRVFEVGQLQNSYTAGVNNDSFRIDARLQSFIHAGTRTQITNTYYDSSINITIIAVFGSGGQQNLRSRVATRTYRDVSGLTYNYASHYSYDVHGTVQTLIQEFPELVSEGYEFFRMDYDYDLISGKVNYVTYQKGKPDQFFHEYVYDADNRVVNVMTSRDSVIWDEDAEYTYYLHGPLARMELGSQQVQGVDYAYTLQGWLKGVNSNTLVPGRDMGQDGWRPGIRSTFGRDAYGFTINYDTTDYQSVGKSTFEASYRGNTGLNKASPSLYNGNIRNIIMATTQFGIQGMAYNYDQLNRLASVDVNRGMDSVNNTWLPRHSVLDYHESFNYDAMGNILSLVRHGKHSQIYMDSLTYHYYVHTNRLKYVSDSISSSHYPDDIDNQVDTNNYKYDAIGNLAYDNQGQILSNTWNVYSKITGVVRTLGSTQSNVYFNYDASQMRVRKLVNRNDSVNNWTYTYYVRDAQGKIMATYNKAITNLHILKTTDCNRVLPTIDSIVGDSNYKHFITNNFIAQPFFLTGMVSQVQTDTTWETVLLRMYNPSWYVLNDANPALITTILNHYNKNTIVADLLNYTGRNTIINYFWGINGTALRTQAITGGNCIPYLTSLSTTAPGSIPIIYAHFAATLPPMPPTPAAQINNLCSAGIPNKATLAAYIFSMYPAQDLTVFQGQSTSTIMSILVAVYPAGIPITNAQLQSLYSNYNLAHCLETSDAGLKNWLAWHYPRIELLNTISFSDPAHFVNAALGHNLSWAKMVICGSGFDMNAFIGIVQGDPMLGAGVATTFWIHWNGTAAGMQEKFSLDELDLYGSKRLGVLNVDTMIVKLNYDGHTSGNEVVIDHLYPPVFNLRYDSIKFYRILGKKSYELANHLGNVMATVSDRKIAIDTNGDFRTDFYQGDVRSAQEYFTFGSMLEGRRFSTSNYSFGFNGYIKDDEVHGEGNSYDFGDRIYDSRTGRFLSLDPLSGSFAYQSNYIFAGNNPILFIDYNGKYQWPALSDYSTTYPCITNYLMNNIQNDVNHSADVKGNLIFFGHYKESELPDVLKYNSGPTIHVEEHPDPTQPQAGNHEADEGNNFSLTKPFLDQVEGILKNSKSTPEAKQAAIFSLYTVILHETVHIGDELHHTIGSALFPETTLQCGYKINDDRGAEFERNTWGMDVGGDAAACYVGEHHISPPASIFYQYYQQQAMEVVENCKDDACQVTNLATVPTPEKKEKK